MVSNIKCSLSITFYILHAVNGECFWMHLLSYILITVFYSDFLDEEHASWVRLQPPCWPVYSICGSVDRLRRQLGWHSRAFPLSPCCYTQVCVWGVGVDTVGPKSPPFIIRPRCLLPLQDPGSWLDFFVAKSNLRDSLGIASGYRKPGQWKRQMTTHCCIPDS